MRITQGIIYGQSLRNLQRNLGESNKLQTQIATGLRVQRPSDDPTATLRILPLTTEVKNLDLLRDNARLARETLDTGAASLEDASNLIQRLRELVIQGANGSVSGSDRRSLGQEADQILQQMVSIANSQRGGRFLFGGTITDSPPFALTEGTNGSQVAYNGNLESVRIDVAPGIQTELNIPGSSIFQGRRRTGTTLTGNTGATLGSGTTSGNGVDTLTVDFGGLSIPGSVTGIAQGSGTSSALGTMSYTYTNTPPSISINGGPSVGVLDGEQEIPVGNDAGFLSLDLTLPITPASGTFTSQAAVSLDGNANITLVDFSSSEVSVTDGATGSSMSIDVSDLRRTGNEQVVFGGITDLFDTMIRIRDLLQNDNGDSAAAISNGLTQSLADLDQGHEQLLDGLRGLGFRSDNMNLVQNRVDGLQTSALESLSESRDVDLVEAITKFNESNTNFQAALQVSASVVQLSLLNFL